MNILVSNGPYAAEGWMEFLDNEDEVWLEAFETTENGQIDLSAYDEFDNMNELVNFVAGTGSYQERNSFGMTEEDADMRKRQMHNDQWKVPEKIENIQDYMAQGEPYADINIDPHAESGWNISERDARKDGKDTKYTAHFIAYDPDEDGGEGASVYFEISWYDKDPSEFNLEEEFDFDDVSDRLEEE